MLKNTQQRYGLMSVALHWVSAVAVFFLFILGLWMDGLDYYDSWYRLAPHIHKSIGVLLIILIVFRLLWRIFTVQPESLSKNNKWEHYLATAVHFTFYGILFSMFVSGYLITTAKGDSLQVFNWFSLPASLVEVERLEDLAGEIHELLAFTLIALVILHAAAAMKHHFIDKDATLKRIFGLGPK